jgi:hypothetical protein
VALGINPLALPRQEHWCQLAPTFPLVPWDVENHAFINITLRLAFLLADVLGAGSRA